MEKTITNNKDILNSISQLPKKFSTEEVNEALNVLSKIKQGLNDFENGRFVTQEELKEEIKNW